MQNKRKITWFPQMVWKPTFTVEKVIYLDYVVNEHPVLNLFAFILTSLKLHHCLNVIIFCNIFVHVHKLNLEGVIYWPQVNNTP